MKFILVFVLIPLLALAEAPPVSVKGYGGSTKLLPKWNLQVPNLAATNLGGIDTLLETGYQNVLANPGFEATPFASGWSCPNFTCVQNTLYFADGKQGGSVSNANAVGSVIEQSVTPSFPVYGRPIQVGMFVNTNSYGFQVCSLFNGVEQACTDAPYNSLTNYVQAPIFTPTSNQTIGVRLKSINTNAKQVFFDAAYVGPANNIGFSTADTGWNDGGANVITGSGGTNPVPGAAVSNHFYWKRNGPNMDVRIEAIFAAGTNNGSGDYLYSTLPSITGCQIDTTKINASTASGNMDAVAANNVGPAYTSATTQSHGHGFVAVYDATHVRIAANQVGTGTFVYQNSSFFNYAYASRTIATFSVPCLGWTPLTAISSVNANTDWANAGPNVVTATTTNPTKGTTVVDNLWWKKDNGNAKIRIEYQQSAAGSNAGSGDYLWSTAATGCFIDTTKATANTTVGYSVPASSVGVASVGNQGTDAGIGQVSVYDSTHVRLHLRQAAGSGYQPESGTYFSFGITTLVVTASFELPCSNWPNAQNAPQLIGSVINPGATGVTNHFYIQWGSGASWGAAQCSSGTCATFESTAPSGSSVAWTASGQYTLTIPSGTCSGPLLCHTDPSYPTRATFCTSNENTSFAFVAPTSTTATMMCTDQSGAALNEIGITTCDCRK